MALCARLESANIRLSAKCELILLHSSELQPRLGCKFKSVDAKAANCCLSQTAWASAEEGRPGQDLLADRAIDARIFQIAERG